MKKPIAILSSIIAVAALMIILVFGYRDIPLDTLKSKYAPAPSAFVEIEGMNVHYRDEGVAQDTLPIVLIHGTGSSLHTFDEWAETLKTSKRVVRMDLPAFGLTGPFPDSDYSIGHYVEFIREFLNSRGIERCILAGNSLGGEIAWRFTLEYPSMVEKLILIDAAGYPMKSKSQPLAFKIARIPVLNRMLKFITPKFVVRSSVKNVYADKSKVSEELVDRYFELSLRKGNREALVDRMLTLRDTSYVEKISNIQQPTLILWGEQDQLITVESANRFHHDLPNDTLIILPDSGHVPMEENPEESLKAALRFINR